MSERPCPYCGTNVPENFKFCGACGRPLGQPVAESVDPPPPEPPAHHHPTEPTASPEPFRSDLRDVTVLFGDLKGFTSLSEKLDPEAVQEIVNACFEGLGRIITEHGGHIDKYMGDGIMALFGAPIAREDDSQRAAEAALAMQAFMRRTASRSRHAQAQDLKMRIGMHCGLVVAGGVGAAQRQDYSVVGDVVNTASRLESAAEPGAILVSMELRQRLLRRFRFGKAKAIALKGKAHEFEVCELLDEISTTQLRPQGGERAFVGRDGHLRKIAAALSKDDEHAPRWIEVVGSLGVGKSRLVEKALEQYRSGGSVVSLTARPATFNRPYGLARSLIHAYYAAGRSDDPAPRDRSDFMTSMSPLLSGLDPYVEALWYLSAPDHLDVEPPDPNPVILRRTLEQGLLGMLANFAALRPDTVVFIDAFDFSDDASRKFLIDAVLRGANPSPRIVSAGRKALLKDGQDRSTCILVESLDRGEADQLLDELVMHCDLPHRLRQNILDRADGVPLHIEELVRQLKDEAILVPDSSGNGYHCDPSARDVRLPDSLLGTMLARLDRLAREPRDLLCQCAIQGVEFDASIAGILWQRRGGTDQSFRSNLTALQQSEFIARTETGGDFWTFRQNLMQNSCYESTLRRERIVLHKDVSDILQQWAGTPRGASAETLAFHFERSEQWLLAAKANLRAAERASNVYENSEAIERFQRAHQSLANLQDATVDSVATAARSLAGAAAIHLRTAHYTDLEECARKILALDVAPELHAEGLRLLAAAHLHTGNTDRALETLQSALSTLTGGDHANCITASAVVLDLADVLLRKGKPIEARAQLQSCRTGQSPPASIACRLDLLEGRISHTEGKFAQACQLYERAHRTASDTASLSEQGITMNHLGNASRDAGQYDKAQGFLERALSIWEKIGDRVWLAGAHNNLANLAISRGQFDIAQHHYRSALDHFSEVHNVEGEALALTNLSILGVETGQREEAIERGTRAVALLGRTGNRLLLALATNVLGEALLAARDARGAAENFEWVAGNFDADIHPLAVAGARRGLGRVALLDGRADDAIALLKSALDQFEALAREQEAARTQIYLAQAYAQSGDAERSRELRRSAISRFQAIGAKTDYERAQAGPAAGNGQS